MNYLKLAFRQLRNSPGFTLVAVLTLALGIGANTAIFSIVNAVLLRPLPYPAADRIMVLNESSGPGQDYSVALPDYFDWRKDNTVFEHLAATHKESRNLSGIPGRDPERVSCASVTRNFFNIVGLPPKIGRTFSEDEDKVGAPPVVVISDRLWRRVFNADPSVLERSITLHDQNFTVIGVMPPQVTLPQDSDVWLSMMRRSNNPVWMQRFIHPMIYVWGKLKPGVTLEQARSEMKTIAARLEKAYPETNGKETAIVTPLLENLVGKYRINLTLLLGAVGLVLLIACANLANLFAARGAARAREFAIHAAVGATRGQIVKKLLIESFVIALLGGALGFFLAIWVRDGLIALSPGDGARFHISGRFAYHYSFWPLACLACIARRHSTCLESRLRWKRRSAIGQTRAGLACDQRNCAHTDFIGRGRTDCEKFFAPAIALTRLRTACALHCALRIAVAKVQRPRQD